MSSKCQICVTPIGRNGNVFSSSLTHTLTAFINKGIHIYIFNDDSGPSINQYQISDYSRYEGN